MKTIIFLLVIVGGALLLPDDPPHVYAGYIAGLITGWMALFSQDFYDLLFGNTEDEQSTAKTSQE